MVDLGDEAVGEESLAEKGAGVWVNPDRFSLEEKAFFQGEADSTDPGGPGKQGGELNFHLLAQNLGSNDTGNPVPRTGCSQEADQQEPCAAPYSQLGLLRPARPTRCFLEGRQSKIPGCLSSASFAQSAPGKTAAGPSGSVETVGLVQSIRVGRAVKFPNLLFH